jgi:hypothetical protein
VKEKEKEKVKVKEMRQNRQHCKLKIEETRKRPRLLDDSLPSTDYQMTSLHKLGQQNCTSHNIHSPSYFHRQSQIQVCHNIGRHWQYCLLTMEKEKEWVKARAGVKERAKMNHCRSLQPCL